MIDSKVPGCYFLFVRLEWSLRVCFGECGAWVINNHSNECMVFRRQPYSIGLTRPLRNHISFIFCEDELLSLLRLRNYSV